MTKTNTQTTNEARAFRKGLRQLRVMDVPIVKAKIKTVLGVKTKQSFISYSFGRMTLDVEKARQIEQVFRDHGVIDCWGN